MVGNAAKTSLLATACVVLSLTTATATAGRLDPCTAPGKIIKGRGFYIGLAFWPGGTPEDWGPIIDKDSGYIGLNPCLSTQFNETNSTHQAYLVSEGVVFSTYEVRVDRMTVLRGNATEQQALLPSNTSADTANAVSVVAFRGPYRSPARYFSSQDASLTGAIGYVQELAVIARVDKGQLQSLQWNDVTCGGCGGRKSGRCITAVTPDATDSTQYSCTVSGNCTTTLTDPCLPSVYLGFSGTDKNSRTFQSGYQITKINQFSLVAFYQRAAATLGNILDTIGTGGVGSGVNEGGVGQGGGDTEGNSAA